MGFSFYLTSCQWKREPPESVLVIAVDSLNVDLASCPVSLGDFSNKFDVERNGFEILCEDSVRFTHAYTSSTMAQPALASLLTAQYPHEHGVWHNGPKFLSAKQKTIAEVAVEKGMRTAFFSGGPPIWSFSGFAQGFENFYDHVGVKSGRLFLPSEKVVKMFLNWLSSGGNNSPFLSFLYLADLQFPNFETKTEAGEVRSRTFDSQLEEIDESLGVLFRALKKKKLWNKTRIVLVGLNGISNPQKPDELKGSNVYSSNTEVTLFIKKSEKKRDAGIQWKIDRNVSLVDVGATLFDFLGDSPKAISNRVLKVQSLSSVFRELKVEWPLNRLILSESSWAEWKGYANTRYAVRAGNLLFVNDQELKAYSTFVDHNETSPLDKEDPQFVDKKESIEKFFYKKEFAAWSGISKYLSAAHFYSRELIKSSGRNEEAWERIKDLLISRRVNLGLGELLASFALENNDWRQLLALAKLEGNSHWRFFANLALNRKNKSFQKGCLKLYLEKDRLVEEPESRECDDEMFVNFVVSHSKKIKKSIKDKNFHEFLKKFRWYTVDKEVYRHNIVVDDVWFVGRQIKFGPSLTELALSLPQNSDIRRLVQNSIK